MPVWSTVYHDYDVLFYHHPWTNNVEIAFGTLSSFLIYRLSAQSGWVSATAPRHLGVWGARTIFFWGDLMIFLHILFGVI